MGFNSQTDQPQLIQKYSDTFFATLYEKYQTSAYQLFKAYMKNMLPRSGEITNEKIDKLRAYLVTAKPQLNTESNDKKVSGNSKQAISHSPSTDAEGSVAENDKAF